MGWYILDIAVGMLHVRYLCRDISNWILESKYHRGDITVGISQVRLGLFTLSIYITKSVSQWDTNFGILRFGYYKWNITVGISCFGYYSGYIMCRIIQ